MYPWQRTTIQRAFSCPVYNRYGCREFGAIAHECHTREGLHINSDRLILEILDTNYKTCPPNEIGEIVITDLDNYGMPLIRYQVGDRGAHAGYMCSCGRGLPLLHSIDGRILDVIRAPNGNILGGTFWTLLFKSKPGIAAFQVIQKNLSEITVNYIKDITTNKIPLDFFSSKIKEKCGPNFQVNYKEVKHIPKTESGKTRFIISELTNSNHTTY